MIWNKSHKNRGFGAKRLLALSAALGVGVTSGIATAQGVGANAEARAAEPICKVNLRNNDGAVLAADETLVDGGTLTASCDGRGYILGPADGYVVAPHRESGAVAVLVSHENDRKVWLFSRREDGGIILEDLTGEFARAVGRSTTSNLVDVRINLARFRATGVISAIPTGRPNARAARAAEISLDRRLPRVRDIIGSQFDAAGTAE